MPKTENHPDIGPDGWDKEAVYDNEIAPLMAQIIAICKREKLPMLFSCVYRNSDDTGDGNTSTCDTNLPGPDGQIWDRYAEAINIIRQPTSFAAFTITTHP